jgi:hypothetical protein
VTGTLDALPVAFQWDAGRFLVSIPAGIATPTGRVKLLIDDGLWYFNLRSVQVRGMLAPIPPPADAAGETWYELVPEKTAAWHYEKDAVRLMARADEPGARRGRLHGRRKVRG